MGFCNTTELQNVFLKLTQCYCNIKQVSEPEVGRFLYFDCKMFVEHCVPAVPCPALFCGLVFDPLKRID